MGCAGGFCGIKKGPSAQAAAAQPQAGGGTITQLMQPAFPTMAPQWFGAFENDPAFQGAYARGQFGQPDPRVLAAMPQHIVGPIIAQRQAAQQQAAPAAQAAAPQGDQGYLDQINQLQQQILQLQQQQAGPSNAPGMEQFRGAAASPAASPAAAAPGGDIDWAARAQADAERAARNERNRAAMPPPGTPMRMSGGERVPMSENYYNRVTRQHDLAREQHGQPPLQHIPPAEGFAAPGLFSGGEQAYTPGAQLSPDTGIIGRLTHAVGGTGNAAVGTLIASLLGVGLSTGAIQALFAANPGLATGGAAAPGAAAAAPAAGVGGAGTAAGVGGAAAGVGATAAANAPGWMGYVAPALAGAGIGAAATQAARSYQGDVRGGKGGMQFPRFTPEQEAVMDQMMHQGAGQAQFMSQQRPFDFQPIANEARRQFYTHTVPTIASRFTGMGAGGQRSSGFRNALGMAGVGLESQLAGQGAKFGLQAESVGQGRLGALLNAGLQPRFDTAFAPPAPSFGTSLGQGIGQGIGMAPALAIRSLFR